MNNEFYELLRQGFVDKLAEMIDDENLDIVDGENITADEFADYIMCLSELLGSCWLINDEYKGYKIKIRNCLKGSVSVSTDSCTGVSRTLYYPFPYRKDDDDLFDAWINLAQMINEAWYECING